MNTTATTREDKSRATRRETTDREIDEIVYEVYGLTKEEIDMIEDVLRS